MAVKPDYDVGTISLAEGGTTITGVDTFWASSTLQAGDELKVQNLSAIIAEVVDNDTIELVEPWTGAALVAAPYRMRFQSDGSRYTGSVRDLIVELGNGNLEAFAALAGALDMIPIFTGTGALTLIPKNELIEGIQTDAKVETLAERAAYDGEPIGFSVLVNDVGDGRSAIYFKKSSTSGDWSTPAYLTGPSGTVVQSGPYNPLTAYVVGNIVLQNGSSWVARVNTTGNAPPTLPTTSNTQWFLLSAAGSGFVFRGAYSGATAYVKDDVVLYNNSSWIALMSTTGNAPPALPTTVNTQWQLIAAKGDGDVSGPASAVDNNLALFNGATGKSLKDSGISVALVDSFRNGPRRNRFVNPSCNISQENGFTASNLVNYYVADQFYSVWGSSTGTFASQLMNNAPTPDGSSNRLRFSCATPDTSLAAGEYWIARTRIEGYRIADFMWGTAAARPIVVAFGFTGPAGTYSIALRNGAGTRSYVANFTITAPQGNTPTRQAIFVPGDTAATVWDTTNGLGMEVSFCFALGTNLQGVAGWSGGAYGTSANTNGMGASGTFYLYDFDMYINADGATAARPFEKTDYRTDLEDCQRYWNQTYNIFSASVTAGASYYMNFQFPVQMRATPSLTLTNVGGTSGFATTPGSALNAGGAALTNAVEARASTGTTTSGTFSSICTANSRL
jgi:hypothetical protein